MKSFSLIFLFVLIYQLASGQFDKEAVDDLILSQTDSDFLACLVYRPNNPQTILDNSKAGMSTFTYDLKAKSGNAVYYRLGGLTSCIIELNYDSNGEIIDAPPFYELIKIKSVYPLQIVEKSKAIENALAYLTKKKVRAINCYLIYDIANASVYWEIKSKAGRKKVTEQTVVIDGLTNQYIRTDEFSFSLR